MKELTLFILTATFLFSCNSSPVKPVESPEDSSQSDNYSIAIHGGAGTILKANMSDEMEEAYLSTLTAALDIGERLLVEGEKATDVVIEVIKYMEDSPLFNAGRGAVFNTNGQNELDASIMRGSDQAAGAIGGVQIIRNPIEAAYAVMTQSEHVLLTGKGAELFSIQSGIDTVHPSYFYTDRRYESLKSAKKAEESTSMNYNPDHKFGTVGCVVLDKSGNLAAGTSTGGMTNKKFNRIGDSPIIGAGTYADNNTVAVSCTGHGEYFIRYAVAYDIAARMEYGDVSLKEATIGIVHEKLVEKGGSGGLIAVDKNGNIEMPFNTEGMYRASSKDGERFIGIYKD
jgi:beta-aspartyl-peptidase (threonine type)